MAFTGRRQAALDEIDEDKEAKLPRDLLSPVPRDQQIVGKPFKPNG